MTVRFELFAAGGASPEATWAVVGDPWKLPRWTDAAEVLRVEPEPVAVGTQVEVVEQGRRSLWRVTTCEHRLLEAVTQTDGGPVGIGVRVAPDPLGSRVILAGLLDREGGALRKLRTRMFDAPALRRRFDRWCQAALREATRA